MKSDREYFGYKQPKGYDDTEDGENPQPNLEAQGPAGYQPKPAFEKNWAGGYDPVGAGGNNSQTKPDTAFTNQNTPISDPNVAVGATGPVHAQPSATYNPNAGGQTDYTKLYGSRDWTQLEPVFSRLYDEAYAAGGPDKAQWLAGFKNYIGNSAKGFEDYWVQRALGQGAGGGDVATSGKYKGQDFGTYEQQHGGGQSATQPVGQPQAYDNQQAVNDYILKLLSGEATRGVGQNIESDPAVAAYQRASTRKYDKLRAQAAESAVQSGTIGSGGFEGMLRGLKEDQASDVAAYAGDRVVQAMQQRRDEIVQAIQMANQAGQFQQSIALQRELARLNADIQRRGQDINQTLANNQLGFNYADLAQRANRDAVLAVLGK